MRNRTIKKQFWLNETEDNLLKEKSKKAGLSEAEFIRSFINFYFSRTALILLTPAEEDCSFLITNLPILPVCST